MLRKLPLIARGGIRTGAGVAEVLALGADAVSIGTAAQIALDDDDAKWAAHYPAPGSAADAFDDWHDPAGITTQDAVFASRFAPVLGGRRLKNHLHNPKPEDLCSLTIRTAAEQAGRLA